MKRSLYQLIDLDSFFEEKPCVYDLHFEVHQKMNGRAEKILEVQYCPKMGGETINRVINNLHIDISIVQGQE